MSEIRETTNADMYRAIPRLAGDRASGRVEQDILFGKNVAPGATFFPKREKTYHAAAGKSGLQLVKRPV